MQTVDFQRLQLGADDTVLDLGCGEGRHVHAAAWHTEVHHVVGADINAQDLTTARERHRQLPPQQPSPTCSFTVADGRRLPFSDSSFDVVICSEVLEHIEHYQSVLLEIRRVLKPGGRLAVSVPRAWPERLCWRLSSAYHQVEGGHVRIFDAQTLRNEFEQQSLTFTGRHWAHALHTPYWWLRCLFWREHKQVAAVRCYHRLLVWDLMQRPWLTRSLEICLNPLFGKSVVMYFTKEN